MWLSRSYWRRFPLGSAGLRGPAPGDAGSGTPLDFAANHRASSADVEPTNRRDFCRWLAGGLAIPSGLAAESLWHAHGVASGSLGAREPAQGGASSAGGGNATTEPPAGAAAGPQAKRGLFEISLNQFSLQRSFLAFLEQKTDPEPVNPLDFAKLARQTYGLSAVQYATQFFPEKPARAAFVDELAKRAAGEGVESLLLMVDREGQLGDADPARRLQVVEAHLAWAELAKSLGCKAVRVQVHSSGTYEEQRDRVVEGLRKLAEGVAPLGLDVVVENHGGLSSNGAWLAEVIDLVDHQRIGTLPDFGNFRIGEGRVYDRYLGVAELMPFAKAVTAKAYEFDEQGFETQIDFRRLTKIVLDAGYRGYIGAEYAGAVLAEVDGTRATIELLKMVREELSPHYAS